MGRLPEKKANTEESRAMRLRFLTSSFEHVDPAIAEAIYSWTQQIWEPVNALTHADTNWMSVICNQSRKKFSSFYSVILTCPVARHSHDVISPPRVATLYS